MRHARILVVFLVVVANPRSGFASDALDRIDALLARYQELGLFNADAIRELSGLEAKPVK